MLICFELNGISHRVDAAPGTLLTEMLHSLGELPDHGLLEVDGRLIRCDLMLAAQVHERKLVIPVQVPAEHDPSESLAGGRV